MFTKILVPVDGSPPSNAAVDLALRIAAENKAAVKFVHVVELSRIAALSGPSAIDPALAIDAACAAGKSVLDQATEKAQAAGVTCKSELLEDECVPSVVQAAHQAKADLIVAGSHGRTGIPRAFLGSVAEGILRRADIPVLICHASAVEPHHKQHDAIKIEARTAEHTLL